MIYDVTHRTTYAYDDEVSSSHGLTHLLPREFAGQSVLAAGVAVDPVPDDTNAWTDHFGNRATTFTIHRPHTRLEITSTATVAVEGRQEPDPADRAASCAWEAVVAAAREGSLGTPDRSGDPDLVEFVLPSPSVPTGRRYAELAASTFLEGRPVVEGLAALASWIHGRFEFVPGATTVTTGVDEILRERKGVCQDFAHVMLAALRSLGLPARYVSGYLETVPPDGARRLAGADVSHAWVSAWVPDLGWVDVDPTNDQFVGDRYVTTAWGRDYRDVTPFKGVIHTDGTTDELTVTVDVVPREAAG